MIKKIVLGIVKNNHNQVLLVRRKEIEKGGGNSLLTWVFPGGNIEENESPEEAVVREVKEETGYTIRPIRVIDKREHGQFPVHVIYFASGLDEEMKIVESIDEEITECFWVPVSNLAEYITSELNSKVSDYLKQP